MRLHCNVYIQLLFWANNSYSKLELHMPTITHCSHPNLETPKFSIKNIMTKPGN